MTVINLVDIILVIALAYITFTLLFPAIRPRIKPAPQHGPGSYHFQPTTHPECLVYKTYTPSNLVKFDGKGVNKNGRLLLAIERRMKAKDASQSRGWTEVRLERTVFDVTSGASFYGPGKWISHVSVVSSGKVS